MGLISKTVKIRWHNTTKKYYESKGYHFTNYRDEFEIKVEDLTKGSHTLVNVKCNCEDCKNPYLKPMEWKNYQKCVHIDGKYYCEACATKLFAVAKIIKTRLLNSKSFEQWCFENDRQDVLNRWDYKLNELKPNEVSFSSGGKKGYWFKCAVNKEHLSELKNINNFTHGHKGSIDCNQCNSFAKYLIELYGKNALNLYWDYEKNIDENGDKINPWQISRYSNVVIYLKCQDKSYHESHPLKCASFNEKSECPYCGSHSNNKLHKFDSLGMLYPQVLDIWSEKNNKTPYEYSPYSNKKVWWKCLDGKHEDYYRDINSSNKICKFRCPECVRERDESFLQEKVRLYLESLNIGQILHENKCTILPKNPKVLKGNNRLPFDNEVKELKLIIEVHGKQHYEITGFTYLTANCNNTTLEYEFHYQKLKDRYKKFIAYKQKYNYLVIPYWTDDEDETWKILINDKIKYINIKCGEINATTTN